MPLKRKSYSTRLFLGVPAKRYATSPASELLPETLVRRLIKALRKLLRPRAERLFFLGSDGMLTD